MDQTVSFVKGDLTKVDFSDGDVVFVNSTWYAHTTTPNNLSLHFSLISMQFHRRVNEATGRTSSAAEAKLCRRNVDKIARKARVRNAELEQDAYELGYAVP